MVWRQVVAATALVALSFGLFACSSKDAEPDRVVGVILKCTDPAQDSFDASGNLVVVPARELSSAECERFIGDRQFAVWRLNARYVVTVRTSNGGSYTVEVPATRQIRVGQTWPPYQAPYSD